MIDDEAEQSEAGEHHRATGRGRVADHRPVAGDDGLGLAAAGEPEVAEDVRLGEAERALLEWALRQRQSGPGEPLLRAAKLIPEPAPDPDPPEPTGHAAPEPPPEPEAPPAPYEDEAPPAPPEDEARSPWDVLHDSAEEAISALIAVGGPDPRDFASPRLTRRAKLVIAVALLVLFVVSALGGFVGYRLTHRAAGSGTEAVGRPAGARGGAV